MAWATSTLGHICDESGGHVRTGPFGSQLHEYDYVESGIPVVMPKNIIDGRIDTSDIAMVDDETAERLSQHRMVPGDIVYGRRGDIGRRAYISENEAGWLCGTGCLRVSPGNRIVDPLFLYYYLGTSTATDWLKGQAIGATLPNLNTTILRNLSVPVPPIATQRQIADTLSAYDDLIENNTRRIAILEEMAQRLYREWFVHFRYPGHESVPLVESGLGPIPEGWEVRGLFEVVDATYGFPFKSSMFNAAQEGRPVIRIRDIVRNQSETYTTQSAESRYEINNGDLLIGMDGTFYTSIWMGATGLLNQRVVRLVPKIPISSLNLKFLIRARIAELNDSIVGTTVAHLSDRDLRAIRVAVPPFELLHRATRLFEPLRQTQQLLTHQAVNLTALKRLTQAKLLVH